ncbi:MAG TPA: molybdopterin cofactor-binding domain-containing protein [Acetobacteraceae bacterium]|nr:molybdopterin cofactor-binding domain-containing protein [Acetobacteraceae bacterium]
MGAERQKEDFFFEKKKQKDYIEPIGAEEEGMTRPTRPLILLSAARRNISKSLFASFSSEKEDSSFSRRTFLITGAAACGGLLIGLRGAHAAGKGPYQITVWLTVGTDGAVTIFCPSQEMGQGIYSGLAQIVAEELRTPWTTVQVAAGPLESVFVNPLLGAQMTAASSSVRGFFSVCLEAGAIARQMLIEAGAKAMGVKAKQCIAENGMVVVQATGQSISFGAVARAASRRTPPKSAKLYSANGYVLVGQSVARPEIPSKVNGTAIYGTDVVVPGMQYGAVLLCPTRGGTVASVGSPPSGSQVVNLGVGIAAVANTGPNCTTWAAMQAALQTKVTWNIPQGVDTETSKDILAEAITLLTTGTAIVAESVGDVQSAQAGAAKVLTLIYILPYLPHATLETPNCTASVTATSCEIWAPTQAPAAAQAAAAAASGLPLSAVTVNCVQMGGGLGRKLETDYVTYAVQTSQALGVPVQLVFPREQDFLQDQYRPMAVCQVTVGLEKNGSVVSWDFRNVSPSILYQRGLIQDGQLDTQATEGATDLPYAFPNLLVDWVRHPAAIPVGFWRSVGNSINAFAVECAIDEAAKAAKTDALAYRLAMLAGNARAIAVLNTAAAVGGWGTNQPGVARGLAYCESFGSLAAVVVTITESDNVIQLVNVACAVDCGMVINPNTATQQIEGGITQGLGSALWGQMQFKNAVAQTSNFDAYRMPLMADMPTIDITLLQTPGAAIGGLGEVGVPCLAPALANAWAALTGKRLRTLPLFPT